MFSFSGVVVRSCWCAPNWHITYNICCALSPPLKTQTHPKHPPIVFRLYISIYVCFTRLYFWSHKNHVMWLLLSITPRYFLIDTSDLAQIQTKNCSDLGKSEVVLAAVHNNNNISGHNNNNNNLHHISISNNNQNYHLNTGKVYRQASDEPSVTSILSQKSMDYVRRNSFGDLSTFFLIFFFSIFF